MDKLIITVAPTGSVPRKKDTPYLPESPEEIAESAYRCEQEGASVVHIHCRDSEENPTLDPRAFEDTVDRIRKRTHLIVMVSTSGIAAKSDEERVGALLTRPDMASLTAGSLNFASRKPSVVYTNSVETISFLAKRMRDAGVKPEIEAFDVGFIQQGVKFIDQGLVQGPGHFQLVMGVDGGIPATLDNLLHMRRQLPSGATFSVAGIGRAQLEMTTMAILMGGHVRVGLEDNILYSKGKLAPNEDFVARVRTLASTLQREVASPAEARRLLAL